jgi:hypothetical protein
MTTERTTTDPMRDTTDEPAPPIPESPAVDVEEEGGPTSTADLARAASEPREPEPEPDAGAEPADDDGGRAALFEEADASDYRSRWQSVQTDFVDDPRQAVQNADALVAELMQRLAETFAGERSELEAQWDRGGQVSTEDLRVAMQRYRSFFDRLLSL